MAKRTKKSEESKLSTLNELIGARKAEETYPFSVYLEFNEGQFVNLNVTKQNEDGSWDTDAKAKDAFDAETEFKIPATLGETRRFTLTPPTEKSEGLDEIKKELKSVNQKLAKIAKLTESGKLSVCIFYGNEPLRQLGVTSDFRLDVLETVDKRRYDELSIIIGTTFSKVDGVPVRNVELAAALATLTGSKRPSATLVNHGLTSLRDGILYDTSAGQYFLAWEDVEDILETLNTQIAAQKASEPKNEETYTPSVTNSAVREGTVGRDREELEESFNIEGD